MTTSRVLIAALLSALLAIFAAPASAQDYGEFGVFGSPSGNVDEDEDIDVEFVAIGLNCSSWTVLSDDTGDAPGGGPGGDSFSFTVNLNEGTYSITARCNGASIPSSFEPSQAGVAQVQPAGYIQGAGENTDTITLVVDEDDDDGDGDGDNDGDGNGNGGDDRDSAGGLPDTGGENRGLLLMGGGLVLTGAAAITISRLRRES